MKGEVLGIIAASALALLLNACGNGLDKPGSTLSVAITDAPACGFDHVYVTIKRVRVNVSTAAAESDSSWIDITPSSPQEIDLLSLSNGLTMILGQASLPPADYQLLHLELVTNAPGNIANTIVPSGGSAQPLDMLDTSKDDLSIVSPISVGGGKVTEVVLDFDVCRSIVQRGDGSFALKPSISSTQMHTSGGINGYVDPALAGASVFAEINGSVVKGTRADAAGRFVLAPVPAGNPGESYDVVIVKDDYAAAIITGVPVTVGVATPLSTQAVPITLPAATMHAISGTVSPASALATVYARQMTVTGGRFSTRLVNANSDTGAWSLAVPSAPPLTAVFGTLPLTFFADTPDAGNYLVSVVPDVGTSQNLPADVAAGDVTGIDANF